MGIDLSSTHISMPQQRLHRANITTSTQQLSSKGMPKGMTTNRLFDTRYANGLFNSALNGADMHMMANAPTIFVKADTA